MKPAQYLVEMYINGWEDAGWTEDDMPLRFPTEAEAQAAIDEFMRDVEDAVKTGDMAGGYDREDYRVAIVE